MGNQNARWSQASDVIPMFPTLVWKIELGAQLREAIGARVLAALAHLRRDLPPLAPGQGWQSVQSLHELDDFRDLVSCVHRVLPGILQFLRIGYDAYEVTACWATVLARGAPHKMHQHPIISERRVLRPNPSGCGYDQIPAGKDGRLSSCVNSCGASKCRDCLPMDAEAKKTEEPRGRSGNSVPETAPCR